MKAKAISFMKAYTIVPILVVLLIVIAVLLSGTFFTFSNIRNILFQNAAYGVMAVGMTFLMLTGYRDLSVGTLMGLCVSLTIGLQKYGLLVSIIVPLLVGVLVGLMNGFFVSKVGISSFIVTFASMYGCRGAIYLYTQEQSYVGSLDGFAAFGRLQILNIPVAVIIFLALLFVSQWVLAHTKHGRETYAVGGNAETARNAGINVLRVTMWNFVLCSVAAALGGIMMAAKLNSSTPSLGWPDTHLQVITMVVLGGTKLTGGYGNMYFTLGGVVTMGIVNNIIDLLGVGTYYNTMVTGAILIAVMIMDKYLKPDDGIGDVMN